VITGCWILDAGYWMLDTGCLILVAGIEEAEGRGRKAEVNVEHRTSNVE
jgi:hypothetical protein